MYLSSLGPELHTFQLVNHHCLQEAGFCGEKISIEQLHAVCGQRKLEVIIYTQVAKLKFLGGT